MKADVGSQRGLIRFTTQKSELLARLFNEIPACSIWRVNARRNFVKTRFARGSGESSGYKADHGRKTPRTSRMLLTQRLVSGTEYANSITRFGNLLRKLY